MRTISLQLTLLLASTTLAAESGFTPAQINNAASFLAGMEPQHAGNEALFQSSTWKSHQSQMTKQWDEYRTATLNKLSAWAEREIAPHTKKNGVVRYMFSGPDILHAVHMFPDASVFVLCGLEPVGVVPDLEKTPSSRISSGLWQTRNSLSEIIEFSFFRTKDMKEDLRQPVFPGTIPIMLLFLAASDQSVTSIDYLKLNPGGTVQSLGSEGKGAKAVRIEFTPRDQPRVKRSLYYFSTDISNGDVEKSGFLKFLQFQPKGASYAKAASYLMHNNYFSTIRDHLITHSNVFVQDDSGIPYRFFDREQWDITLFGTYVAPIDLFANKWQRDLYNAYRREKVPIDFGTGYKWRKGQSNLMRAVRNQ